MMNMIASVSAGLIYASIAASAPVSFCANLNRYGQSAYTFPEPNPERMVFLKSLEGSEDVLVNFSASKNLKKLSEIEKLKDNWNGYGAAQFEKKL